MRVFGKKIRQNLDISEIFRNFVGFFRAWAKSDRCAVESETTVLREVRYKGIK